MLKELMLLRETYIKADIAWTAKCDEWQLALHQQTGNATTRNAIHDECVRLLELKRDAAVRIANLLVQN